MDKLVVRAKFEDAKDRHYKISEEWIYQRGEYLHHKTELQIEERRRKMNFAAALIQGLGRGYIARIRYFELCEQHYAALQIQTMYRGYLGRLAAWEARYALLRVVPAKYSLNLIRSRSRQMIWHKPWQEYFDPWTNSFWYLNTKTNNSQWAPPDSFRPDMVCIWDPELYPHVNPMDKQCRKPFKDMARFNHHRLNVHKWYCPACDYQNSSVCYPTCGLCENRFNFQAKHMFRVYQDLLDVEIPRVLEKEDYDERIAEGIRKGLIDPVTMSKQKKAPLKLEDDGTEMMMMTSRSSRPSSAPLSARTPRGKIGTEKQETREEYNKRMQGISDDDDDDDSEHDDSNSEYSHTSSSSIIKDDQGNKIETLPAQDLKLISVNDMKLSDMDMKITEIPPNAISNASGIAGDHSQTTTTLPEIGATASAAGQGPQGLELPPILGIKVIKDTENDDHSKKNNNNTVEPESKNNDPANMPTEPPVSTKPDNATFKGQSQAQQNAQLPSKESSIQNRSTVGQINLNMNTHMDTGEKMNPQGIVSVPSNDDDNNNNNNNNKNDNKQKKKGKNDKYMSNKVVKNKNKLTVEDFGEEIEVCKRFLVGVCNKTTCPQAHPSIRDSAIKKQRGTKKKKKWFVKVCHEWIENGAKCSNDLECKDYHVYIRPSTLEICKKVYTCIRNGHIKIKQRSGATVEGHKKNDLYDGVGIYTWPDGSQYYGCFKANERDGPGVYRKKDGTSYVGEWKMGKRDGMGVFTAPNGDSYAGEWKFGQKHGAGSITSINGDEYHGTFEAGKFTGIGRYQKGNGTCFVGQTKGGKAEGIGIVAYANGEKYKGEFHRNARHGRGVCHYPNGCRYIGYWFMGFHSGFGIFLSKEGERYVGEWQAGLKHGKGRYIYANGDFYDGDFRKNLAHGTGLYRHHDEGNVYIGAWKNDKKNGRGMYRFSNGSWYDGMWDNNDAHGSGTMKFAPQGAWYRGQFHRNTKHGEGHYMWKNGSEYKGDFVHDSLCGFADMKYGTSGHHYEGNWLNSKKHGKGKFWYADGNYYEGYYKEDIMHGRGKFIYQMGSILEEEYDGEWEEGIKHGKGTYRYQKRYGMTYQGDWNQGKRDGRCKILFKDKSFYEGDINNERFSGNGIFVQENGNMYDGDWRDNLKEGIGTMLAAGDGTIFKGAWERGMKHGTGSLTYPNGNRYDGTWSNDSKKGKGAFFFRYDKKPGSFIKLKVFGC